MLRSVFRAAALAAAAALVVSCNDTTTTPTTNGARKARTGGASSDIVPGTCTTLSDLQALVNTVFGAGSPNANSALGKLSNLDKQLQQGNLAGAQDQAMNIVTFVQQKATQGGLPGTPAQVQQLISNVLCYAGLPPDSFLIYPTDAPQVLKEASGKAGISLQGNTVSVPTLVTIQLLASSPLITKLDTYPGYVEITTSSQLTKTAVVGVCPSGVTDPSVLARLRLGHQGVTGFEITPAADASFLDCSTTVGQSSTPKWLKALANLVLPTPAYAKTMFAGGVGGLADSFSPFGTVDTELQFAGGVGGLADSFKATPPDMTGTPGVSAPPPTRSAPMPVPTFNRAPGARVNTVDVNGVCTSVDATEGTPLELGCRPEVTLQTAKGTLISAPVNWAVVLGGGTIAPEASTPPCTPYGSTAATITDANGKARICWILGPNSGTNTVKATPTAGAPDLPAGVSFNPPSITFTAMANAIVPVATATGGTFVFDNSEHLGSGTCTNGLTPAYSYSGGSNPKNVGTYTLTITCGDGGVQYTTVTKTAQIVITAAPTTTNVTCQPSSVVYTGSPFTPCSATVTGPGLSAAVTPVQYSSNTDVGTATATASYSGGGNYQASTGSATFQITVAASTTTVNCSPSSLVYTGSPLTPCSATATGGGGLNVAVTPVTYTSNTNAGTAGASATFGGDANHAGSTGSATFTITPAATTAQVTCPTSVSYTGSPITPCTGGVTGPGGLSLSLTPTYTSNIVGKATATVTYAGGGNYQGSTASKTFQISYVQSGCFASPVYSVMPSTKSFQNKGSNLPIKCTLLTASGAGVTNATGDLLVEDIGTDGSTATTVFSQPNVFKVSGSGNYAYGLDTNPAGFRSQHFYRVTAFWSDGSKTIGFFYIK